ncbi:MAG: HAMP domain-containing sensor histidine kinase, partial [Solirubrobacteraceae bacterium]|nr:HAMP domain-containing sensor histidine kinase [Solirubrobacteraceae bacterium]
ATFVSWTGYPAEELLGGRSFVSLLTVGNRILYETHCLPMLIAGHDVEQMSFDLRCADGSVLPVLFGAAVHSRDEGGAISIIRVTLVELGQRRMFEQALVSRNDALVRANEVYEAFSHAAAHDLRAPLRGLRMGLEFFVEDTREQLSGAAEQDLEHLLALTDRMRVMLDGLAAYAQGGTGAWMPVEVSLGTAMAEVVELLRPPEDARISVSDARLFVDPTALRQLLLNLVGNAIKYSDGPAQVTVAATTLVEAAEESTLPAAVRTVAGDSVVLTVADRGIGIEDMYRENVFTLFRQLDAGSEGSGTGLALCRLVCRNRGGDVWLSSTPGEGTTFFASFG